MGVAKRGHTAWRENRDVPVTKGSFFREAVLYSWNGMSLVNSLRTLFCPVFCPVLLVGVGLPVRARHAEARLGGMDGGWEVEGQVAKDTLGF